MSVFPYHLYWLSDLRKHIQCKGNSRDRDLAWQLGLFAEQFGNLGGIRIKGSGRQHHNMVGMFMEIKPYTLLFVEHKAQGANFSAVKPDRSGRQWHFSVVDHGLDVRGVFVGLVPDEPEQGLAELGL